MLNRRSVLRATLAGAVAGGTVLSTTDDAAGKPATTPTPTAAAVGVVPNGARLATAAAALGCGGLGKGGLIFGVHSDGTLWGYPSARVPDACEVAWLPESQLGQGWDNIRRVFADHNATDKQYPLFAIDLQGNLRWYAYDLQGRSWAPGSGATIGTGWDKLPVVTYAGDGVFYAVADTGELRWYRDLDPFGGSGDFDPASGRTIGSGWGAYPLIFASGGSIYAITNDGELLWYGYSDPTRPDGTFSKDSGRVVGTGWNIMVTVDAVPSALKSGVLVHGIDGDGHLREYLNLVPSASANWAAGSGNIIGTHDWLN